jgi:biopolymer transport protein ExbB
MKLIFWLGVFTALLLPAVVGAQDMRSAFQQAEQDRQAEEAKAAAVEAEILADRTALLDAVEQFEAEQQRLEAELVSAGGRIATAKTRRERLEAEWAEHELDFKEISGNVRLAARDLETMLHQSPFTALAADRLDKVAPLVQKGYFPDIEDISGMTAVILDEMARSGQVRLQNGKFVGRDGVDVEGTILTLGKFITAYQTDQETGFLSYQPEGQRFYALSTLPGGSIGRRLRSYLAGESDEVPIDLSGGNAVRQVAHQVDFRDQLHAGGPLVYPIIAIALLALLIVLYKILFLNRVHSNTDRIMGQVNELAAQGDWEGIKALMQRFVNRRSPVLEVIRAGLTVKDEEREIQESVLQESILHQLPRVERGLALLAVFGAVAPLIGLLGMVTGMIDTFRVITLYGTGDPKLMSGGISEALITTKLGLAVAIPIMLLHTFLSRRVEHIIGEMEEKAVQLTNIIQKDKLKQLQDVSREGDVA